LVRFPPKDARDAVGRIAAYGGPFKSPSHRRAYERKKPLRVSPERPMRSLSYE